MKPKTSQTREGPLRDEALQAFRDAIGKVIAEHKRFGVPLCIWRDGQICMISPEQAEAEYAAVRAQQTTQNNSALDDTKSSQ